MGCFIACLGGTKKQKRLKSDRISQPRHQGLGSYQQLKSVSVKLDVKESSTCHEAGSADSELNGSKEKPTSRSVLGARKKVSFNLIVETYEPINSQDYSDCEDDEITKKKENDEVGAGAGEMEDESTTSYPSNYRYKNFIDCENEEDDDNDVVTYNDSDEEDDFDDCLSDHELDQSIQGKGVFGLSDDERFREVHSVLSPVENTAQWRAVKVKTTASQSRHQCKENATSDQRIHTCMQQETRVDVSLSSWIIGNGQHNLIKAPVLRTI